MDAELETILRKHRLGRGDLQAAKVVLVVVRQYLEARQPAARASIQACALLAQELEALVRED